MLCVDSAEAKRSTMPYAESVISEAVGHMSRLHGWDWGSGVPYVASMCMTKFQITSCDRAATLRLSPLITLHLSQMKGRISNTAHQSTICDPRRHMRQSFHRRPPRSGRPARASAPSWRARTVIFKLLYAISSSSRVKKASNSGRKRRGWVGRIPRC